MIDKETIFNEFKVAKQKDLAMSKTPEPYEDVYTNRLALLKSHQNAKKSNPKLYRHLDINFDNLIKAYSCQYPIDYFYNVVFGKSYKQYQFDKIIEEMTEKQKEKEEELRKQEKEKLKIEDVEEVSFH